MATVTCPGCEERDRRIAALEARVAELEALVRDLTARLGANARNASLPPSANPPGSPKPVPKAPTGRQPVRLEPVREGRFRMSRQAGQAVGRAVRPDAAGAPRNDPPAFPAGHGAGALSKARRERRPAAGDQLHRERFDQWPDQLPTGIGSRAPFNLTHDLPG
jgi:hypothetical protein